jgi:phenylacetate-coenzyme A ligase PaaK-like adenylate-forming protein
MSATDPAALRTLVRRAVRLPHLARLYAGVNLDAEFAFTSLPQMNRDDVTAAARQARSADPGRSGGAYLFTSGGSTAEPKLAWIPAGLHLAEIEAHWQPIRATDTVANLAMPGRLWSAHLFYNRLAERAGAGVIGLGHVEENELDRWLGFLAEADTTVLVGTPGQLATVLRRCADLGHPLLSRLRAAIWFGEGWGPDLLEACRAAAPALELYGNYGSTETWVVGHNGPDCDPDSFHVLPHQHVEIDDSAVLVTTTHPAAVGPVIRYRVGDRGLWVRCRCGRGSALRVLGREGTLVKLAGTLVDPAELVRIAAGLPGVHAAQGVLVETAPGQAEALELRVVAPAGPDPSAVRRRVLDSHIDLRFGLRGAEEQTLPVVVVDRLETVARTAKTPVLLRRGWGSP